MQHFMLLLLPLLQGGAEADPPDPIDPVGGEDTADILRRKRHRHGGKGGK